MEQDKIIFEEILLEAKTKGTVTKHKEFFHLYRKYINARTQDTKCSSCIRGYMVQLNQYFEAVAPAEETVPEPVTKHEKIKRKVYNLK